MLWITYTLIRINVWAGSLQENERLVGCSKSHVEFKVKGAQMSLSLEDLKGELREGYLRTEEVLAGMDAYIAKLEKRLDTQLKRMDVLEGQMAAMTAALYADDPDGPDQAPRIFVG